MEKSSFGVMPKTGLLGGEAVEASFAGSRLVFCIASLSMDLNVPLINFFSRMLLRLRIAGSV